MTEERQHVRVELTAAVGVSAPGWSASGKATDISDSGMQVLAPLDGSGRWPEQLLVHLPDLDEEVRIPARVTHCTRNGSECVTGLQFEFDNAAQRNLVDSFVRWVRERGILDRGQRANSRRLPRASCSIAVVTTGRIDARIDRLENISTDGFLVTYRGMLHPGDRLALEFCLPGDERPIRAEVSVVHCEHVPEFDLASAGLRIEQIGEIDRARLRNFIVQASSGGTVRTVHNWISQQGLESSFQVSGHETIARYLKLLKNSASQLHLVPAHGHEIRTGIVAELDPDGGTVTLEISTGLPIDADETTIFGSFVADAGSFFFSTTVRRVDGTSVDCSVPDRLFRSEQRSHGRTNPDADSDLALIFDEPDRREYKGRLVDISRGGFLCELPADEDILARLEGQESVRYRVAASLELDTQGEVRHVERIEGENCPLIRIGVEAGIRRRPAFTRHISNDEWQALPVYRSQVGFLGLPGAASRPAHYRDARGRNICALINAIGLPEGEGDNLVDATVFVIPPAFGKKKEALAPLAAVVMANFARAGEPVVVIRYDGTDRPGESDSSHGELDRGYEMLHYRISGGRLDLQATLDYVYNNSRFRARRVAFVTFSMSALDARRVLTDRANTGRVHYWISVMGVPAAQTVLRNTLGGVDVVGNYRMGIPSGVCGLLGHLVDMDRVAQDLIEQRYAYLTDAHIDMAKIDIPVLWLYGHYDMWVPPAEIEDIMSVTASGEREIIRMPAGHNLRTSDDALRAFKLIAVRVYEQFFGRWLDAVDPNKDELLELIAIERERLEKRASPSLDRYWREYLVGRDEPGSGYDVYRNIAEFRRFLQHEVDLLDVRDGMQVADLGCGTGLYLEQLFLMHGTADGVAGVAVTAADLVPEALERAKSKVTAVCGGTTPPRGWTIRYQQADLEPSRLLPVRDLLDDPALPLARLRGAIEGLTGAICQELAYDPDGRLGRFARAVDDVAPTAVGNRALSATAREALYDLNLAARYLRGRHRDGPRPAFKRLKFDPLDRPLRYSFADESFDRINASLFISYLFNPHYAVSEFYRLLRPGGRAVVSSMRPDSDISVIFTDYVEEMTVQDGEGTSLRDAREMLNEAAELFELEEEGFFQFFEAEELVRMLEHAGFTSVFSSRSLGTPAQAVIVTGDKPGASRTT